MKWDKISYERESSIILFVLIPRCKECRNKIERTILDMGYFERVDFGYPDKEGTPVSLVYIPEKHPDVDFWKKALMAKDWLNSMGYRVL